MLKKLYNKHRETLHNFSWRCLQIFGKHGVVFFIFFIAAKLLQPEDFGLFNYLRAVIILLTIFCDFGLSYAISKFTAEYEFLKSEKLNRLLFSASIFVAIIAATISAVIVFTGGIFFKENYRYIVLFLPYLFLMPLTSVIDGFYRGLKQFKKLAIISSIVGGVSVFISFILINRFYLVGAIIAQNIMYLLFVLFLYAFQRKLRFQFDISALAEVLKYAMVVGIGMVANFLYSRVDILILKQFGFVVEIGYYGIINSIFMMLFIPFGMLGQVIAPNTTRHVTAGNFGEIRNKLKKYAGLCIPAGVILSMSLHFAVPVALKTALPNYYTANLLLIMNILLLLLPFKVWSAVLNQGFVAPAGFAKISTIATLVGGVLNVVLDYVFIDMFGFVGVFWVTLGIHSLNILTITVYFYIKINAINQP